MKFFKAEAIQPIRNLAALGTVQLTNYILPLITLPYLIRVLGLENFGFVTVAQAILLYLVILPDYGFNLTSTRAISLNRQDTDRLSEIISVTLATKTILLLLSFLILVILIGFSDYFFSVRILYFWGFSMVLGQTYFPMWFFQGIEKLKYVTWLNFISRTLLTTLIFIFIRKPEDYIFVIPIYAIGGLTGTFLGLFIMFNQYRIKFTMPTLNAVRLNLNDGFSFFISSIANNTFVNSGIMVLSLTGTPNMVGYYAVADKVLLIFRQFMVILSQSVYPSLSKLKFEDQSKIMNILKPIGLSVVICIGVAALFMIIFPEFITIFFTGADLEEINILIQILAPIPVVMVFSALANQLLLVYEFKLDSMIVSIISALVSLILCIILSAFLGTRGIAIAQLITEFFIVFFLLSFIVKRRLGHIIYGKRTSD